LSLVKNKISEGAKHRLCEGVLFLISEDRINENAEGRKLTAKLIHVMLALDFYKMFEVGFCTQTRDFYRISANEAFEQLNVSELSLLSNQALAFLIFDIWRNIVLKGNTTLFRMS